MRMKKSRQNGKNGQTPARDKRNSRRQDSNGQSTPFDTSETSESEAEAEVARAADINEVNDKTSVISESNPSLFTSVAAVPDSLLRLNGGGGERAKKEEKNNQDFADTQSVATVRSSMTLSTVSGSGLRFLRNYLKKKQSATATSSSSTSNANPPSFVSHNKLSLPCTGGNTASSESGDSSFNSVAVPYPPVDDFYGPAYVPDAYLSGSNNFDLFDDLDLEDLEDESKRQSIGSTIAELLNETFDSDDDSELRNLDWDEWNKNDASSEVNYGELAGLAMEVASGLTSEEQLSFEFENEESRSAGDVYRAVGSLDTGCGAEQIRRQFEKTAYFSDTKTRKNNSAANSGNGIGLSFRNGDHH